MQCLECGSEELIGVVTMRITAPLTARTGSIKIGSIKVTQIDVKNQWDKTPDGAERKFKGPVVCATCGHEMYYRQGTGELCTGNYLDAISEHLGVRSEDV